ncbi:hypothetical protein MKD49_26085, partial [Herbaspirillum sp. WGmk3]|uniref:hypothetical protein n=1 Tax=Herbaspirillum sp. WGmk3 TaxID=2919925 RepID=UPI002090200E
RRKLDLDGKVAGLAISAEGSRSAGFQRMQPVGLHLGQVFDLFGGPGGFLCPLSDPRHGGTAGIVVEAPGQL